MRHTRSGFISVALIICLVSSVSAQRIAPQRRAPALSEPSPPAVTVIADHPLLNYATRRSGDLFTVTISEAGNASTVSGGQPFEQRRVGTDDLMIAFQLAPGTNPRIEQVGNELRIYFESVNLPATGLPAGAFVPPTPRGTPQQLPGQLTVPVAVGLALDPNEPIAPIQPLDVTALSAPTPAPSTCNVDEPGKDEPKDELVVVDSNTGKILEGRTRVPEDTRVKVVFVNKNPFKYDYSFRLTPTDLNKTTVISFLGLIPGIPGIPGVMEGTIPKAETVPGKAALSSGAAEASNKKPSRASTNAQDQCDLFLIDLNTAVENSVRMAKALTDSAKIITAGTKAYEKFLEDTNKTYDNQGARQERINFANELCASGEATLPKLQAVLDFDFDEFSKAFNLDLFAAQVTILENKLEPLQCDQKPLYKKVIEALKVDVTTFKLKLEELKKKVADSQKKLEPPTKIIKTALGSSRSFAESAYAPTLGDATSVAIDITRRNVRDAVPKDEPIAVAPPLHIGEPRVVLSGGIGFSSINERKIVRQQSLVPDANGAMVLGNRFGFENRSQFRPSGVIMINGILSRFNLFGNSSSFALSGGLVFSNRNDGLATEFIAGPSLGFAKDKIFLTLGFHAARVEELSGGFKIGDPVPDGLTDPLPVQKNWLNGLIMSLTFRIQP